MTIFGATGFTGRLISFYLKNHKSAKNLNWAISGRDQNKLQSLSKELSFHKNIDYLIADSFDKTSLDLMCQASTLIISTVGPYSIYGKNLIEACINNKTHYLDLTGEPEFVNFVLQNYSEKALKNNTLLINCCGFESVIPDVGILYTSLKSKSALTHVDYYLQTKGQISGGTWASFLNSINSKNKTPILKIKDNDPKKKSKKLFFNKRFNKWALFFPVIDKDIVRRSNAHSSLYSRSFKFSQFLLIGSFLKLISLISGFLFILLCSKIKLLRNRLLNFIPPGTGPSKEKRDTHWFKATLIGKCEDGSEILSHISGKDPGYGETAKFISEMALCILTDYDKLNKKCGILTPVECTGDLMIERLKHAGIKFE